MFPFFWEKVLIEKISDLYQEYLMTGEKMDGAVQFIKQVKMIAAPKVKNDSTVKNL